MNWKEVFFYIKSTIINDFGIEVNLFDEIPKHLYADPDIDIPYNGTVFLDQEYPTIIDLYGDIVKYPMEMTCVLIHEFGHVLADNNIGSTHTELDAWLFGKNYFKEQYIPPIFDKIMYESLETYK